MADEKIMVAAEILLQLNRNTAEGWAANDLVLGEGEPALLLDTESKTPIGIKYGDGKTKWSELTFYPFETNLGEDGISPTDIDEIVQTVVDSIRVENPEVHVLYGDVDDENNITLLGDLADGTYIIKYENEDGTTTDVGTITVDSNQTSYTNQIPISTDTDGSIYGGVGYVVGNRIGSTGSVSTVSNSSATNVIFLTGFIPVKSGDVVRMKNCYIDTNSWESVDKYGQNTYGIQTCFYNSSKSNVARILWTSSADNTCFSCTPDDDGLVTEFTIINSDVAYMRISPAPTGDAADAIITVNEEIVEVVKTVDVPIDWEVGLKLSKTDTNHTTVEVVEGTASSAYAASPYIVYDPNVTYTAGFTNPHFKHISVCCYDTDGNLIGYLSDICGNDSEGESTAIYQATITPPDGTATFRLRYYFAYNGGDLDYWVSMAWLTKTS